MKTLKVIFGMALILLFAQLSWGQITGSKHDFSVELWNTYDYVLPYNKVGEGNSQICKVCHTPHNGQDPAYKPLWNHAVSDNLAYTVYDNTTLNAGPLGQPDGTSKMCLGCHDNSTVNNRLDNYAPINGITTSIVAAGNLGGDLSNDHPISFTYDAALATADGGLYDPATQDAGPPYAAGVKIATVMLFGGKVQCASCHNPHLTTYQKFLRKSNINSGLCLTCHNK